MECREHGAVVGHLTLSLKDSTLEEERSMIPGIPLYLYCNVYEVLRIVYSWYISHQISIFPSVLRRLVMKNL